MKRAGDFDWKLLESVTEKETGNAQSDACVDVLPRCLTRLTSTWRKNVMSMRELYCPSPLAGFEKMARFHKYFFDINKKFPLLAWEEQAICLQKLQAVVITFSRLNFL